MNSAESKLGNLNLENWPPMYLHKKFIVHNFHNAYCEKICKLNGAILRLTVMASSHAPAPAHLQITGYLAGWRVEDISMTSNQIASVDPGPG